MSTRKLRALCVTVENSNRNLEQVINNNNTIINVITNIMAIAIMATQVNLFYDTIDLSSAEGKKLYQKIT